MTTGSNIVTAEARLQDAMNAVFLAHGKLGEAASAQVLGGNPRDMLAAAKREVSNAQAAIDKAWTAVCAAGAGPDDIPAKGDNFRPLNVIEGGKQPHSDGPGSAA
jgi:hypothetical protein